MFHCGLCLSGIFLFMLHFGFVSVNYISQLVLTGSSQTMSTDAPVHDVKSLSFRHTNWGVASSSLDLCWQFECLSLKSLTYHLTFFPLTVQQWRDDISNVFQLLSVRCSVLVSCFTSVCSLTLSLLFPTTLLVKSLRYPYLHFYWSTIICYDVCPSVRGRLSMLKYVLGNVICCVRFSAITFFTVFFGVFTTRDYFCHNFHDNHFHMISFGVYSFDVVFSWLETYSFYLGCFYH